jgi:xanthine dehydrogenase YagT iron-sulfur-binding subunit
MADRPERPDESAAWCVTRRDAFKTTSAALVALNGAAWLADQAEAAPAPVDVVPDGVTPVSVRLNVNGRLHTLQLDARTTLLDALREHLLLTGTKKGCDHGQCGACTVLLEGRRINACLTLAVMHDGESVTTIEGLGTPDKLHPMQQAFLHHDGFQCGYCTPGQICSAVGVLAEARAGMPSVVTADLRSRTIAITPEELRERMSGNICRCSAYPNIIAAITDVAQSGGAA